MMNIELKKITEPAFYHCISANRTIIGSKKIMKEGIRNCADIEKMREENNQILDESNLKSYGIERLSTNKYDKGYQTFIIQNGNQKQVINEKTLKKKVYPFTAIRFVGDIDGDNIMDYIIGSDAEQSYDVLFLSGEQKGTNLVEPVAYFYMHYCC